MVSIHRMKKWLPVVGLALAVVGCGVVSAKEPAEEAFPKVAAVTESPTHAYLPGKAIWVDLVTTDVGAAAAFYERVFGWEFNFLADDTYAEASYEGRPVGAITVFEGDEAAKGDAYWLVSFSVTDIDGAVERVDEAGGNVLEGPIDLEGRGRLVLVSDAEGAEVMLLHATGGDPPDATATINEWLWVELWSREPSVAADFYDAVLGLGSKVVEEASGEPYMLLGRDHVARAGVVELTFDDVEPNWLPYILVASVKDTIHSIEKHGGKLVMAPGESADEVTEAIVSDPTGGVFAIQQREN